MMLQLKPPLPIVTVDGKKGQALVILDYGPEMDTLFLIAFDVSRELWWLPNSQLRMQDNISLGRMPSETTS
jgi:hypothetical protein